MGAEGEGRAKWPGWEDVGWCDVIKRGVAVKMINYRINQPISLNIAKDRSVISPVLRSVT